MTAKESQNGGDGAERFPIRFPVEVLLTGESEPGAFETWGVSKAGISLRSQQVIKVDQGIYVKMTLPSLIAATKKNISDSRSGIATHKNSWRHFSRTKLFLT